MQNKEDTQKIHQSMNRLYEIFKSIALHADEVSTYRCPYKNAKSFCTAKFKCQNQFFSKRYSGMPVCTGSDKLNYRSYWE